MAKRWMGCTLGSLALWAGSLAWADSPNPVPVSSAPAKFPPAAAKPKAKFPQSAVPERDAFAPSSNSQVSGNLQGNPAAASEPAVPAPKPVLADAFIAQSVLRVYLNRPAAIHVYNSRGQQVFQMDTRRPMEAVPLQGITTGFIYLTVRTAQGEQTKKLVFTGK